MKVLFINSNQFKQPWPVIPYGLSCVASAVEAAGHIIEVLDLCFVKNVREEIKQVNNSFKPDIVGISIRNIDSGTAYNNYFLLENVKNNIISTCKDLFQVPIIIGGPAVGISGVELLKYLDLNYAIQGDGENAFIEFLKRYERNETLKGMKGLIRIENNILLDNNEPMRVENLDDLPSFNPNKYIDVKKYAKHNSPIQIQTKRGCSLNCTYCTYNIIEGHRYRLKSPKKVADEIEKLSNITGIKTVEFTDSTFNIPLNHCKDVLKALIKKNLSLNLRTMGLNPSAIDEELAGLMKKAGFIDVDLGVDAGNDTMLENMGKNFKKLDLIKASKILQNKKISITWYLLLGGPGETKKTLRETFDTINQAALPWDLINIAVGLRVYNNSPLAHQMKRDNPDMANHNFLFPTSLKNEIIDLKTLKEITKTEALKHPNYFMYDENETMSLFELRFATTVINLFAPKQPIFKLYIGYRKLFEIIGIGWLQRKLYSRSLTKSKTNK